MYPYADGERLDLNVGLPGRYVNEPPIKERSSRRAINDLYLLWIKKILLISM